MPRRREIIAALSAIAAVVAAGIPLGGAPDAAAAPKPGHVYLLRGLANVFSLGMDALDRKLEQEGIAATTLNHAHWRRIADDVAADYKGKRALGPVAIVGHSIGATAATLLAARLAEQGVPVALLVAYDPSFEVTVSPNVRRAVGFHTGSFPGLKPAPGFKGSLENILVTSAGVNHITIDKADDVHARTIVEIKRAFRRR